MSLILASASPRRSELLAVLVPQFEVVPSGADETIDGTPSPTGRVMQLAQRKAQDVFSTHPRDVVVGADTLVFLDGAPLGKPKDREDAAAMLRSLSGRVHEVVTGVCVLWPGGSRIFSETSRVEFLPLSEETIDRYIRSGEPMDKAGGYAIQGLAAEFVKKLDGNLSNVVGLPIPPLAGALKQAGVKLILDS